MRSVTKKQKKKAKDALAQSTWSYDARKLEADTYVALGLEEYLKGNHESALKAYENSGKSYDMAAQFGRSDQAIYLGDCDRWIKTLMVHTDQGNDPQDFLKQALDSCDKAILINPDTAQPYRQKSIAYYRAAEYQIYNTDQDPRAALKKSITNSVEAIRKDSTFKAGYRDTAASYWLLGEAETIRGENAQPSFRESITNSSKAIQLNPNDNEAFNISGVAYTGLAEYKMAHGEDPRPALNKSIEQFSNSLKINNRHAYVYSNLGIVYLDFAEYELGEGLDPRKSLKNSIDHLKNALRINPRDVYAYNNLGLAFGILGEYKLRIGEDPTTELNQAVEEHNKALKINVNDVYAYNNIGIALLFKGQFEVTRGQNPGATFSECIQECQKALKINSDYSYAYNNLGLCYTSSAKYELLIRKPSKNLAAAVQQYEKALTINPDDAQVLGNIGYTFYLLGLEEFQKQKNPRAWLENARRRLQKSIAVDSQAFEPYRTLAEVEILAARWALNSRKEAETFFESADRSLKECLKLNNYDSFTYKVAADYWRWKTLHKESLGQPFEDEIKKGIEMAKKALSLNPNNAEASAILGVFYMIQAQNQHASSAFETAFRINSNLKNEYQSFFQDLTQAHSGN